MLKFKVVFDATTIYPLIALLDGQMPERQSIDFAFLAFNYISGALLAHGKTAAHAALQADHVAPQSPIKIILAGEAGLQMWDARMTYREAGAVFEN